MLILSEAQVRKCLTMEKCIAASRIALSAIRRTRIPPNKQQRRREDDFTGAEDHSGLNMNQNGIAVVPNRIVLPPHPPTATATNTTVASTAPTAARGASSGAAPDMTLFKPAAFYLPATANGDTSFSSIMGMKIVSIRSNNPSIGKPSAPATIAMVDNETTGEVTSIVAATYLTAARCAAGSAIATKLCLGRTETEGKKDDDDDDKKEMKNLHLVVIGAGIQAELHIRALKHVYQDALTKVTIVNRTIERANQLMHRLQNGDGDDGGGSVEGEGDGIIQNVEFHIIQLPPVSEQKQATSSPSLSVSVSMPVSILQQTIQSANIIVTATNTNTPIINWYDWVSDGTHINGLGSYQSSTEEVDCTFVKDRCHVLIDTMDALDVGDLKYVQEDSDYFMGLVGDFITCTPHTGTSGTTSDDGEIQMMNEKHLAEKMKTKTKTKRKCTFYKAVGTAIQDIVTAQSAIDAAKELGLGTNIDMS